MKLAVKIKYVVLITIVLLTSTISFAQFGTYAYKRQTIALFLPLYLDSAFEASGEYHYGKQFPKFINPGLEFYEGAQMALDSLHKLKVPLDVLVYDTRSSKTIAEITQQPAFANVGLMIGYVSNNEIKPLADIAHQKNIPFINVNIPNDGGVSNNPSLVILNSTLHTHCEGIYRFLQKTYSLSPIIMFRKAGTQEDRLKGYFNDMDKSTTGVPLKIKYVTLKDGFTQQDLLPYLDSTRQTMCIAGSLDETFSKQLCQQLAVINAQYPLQVMGMPNWDGFKDFDKKEYKGLDIYYSTPFYYAKTDKISLEIQNYFKNTLYSRPSDMVFRGYETTMRFSKLLLEYGSNIENSIGEKKYKVFSDFDIQPAILNKQTQQLEYFENRKLYFIKKTDGLLKGVY